MKDTARCEAITRMGSRCKNPGYPRIPLKARANDSQRYRPNQQRNLTMKEITVQLPDPGPLSDHHADDEVVFYHGQYGEFVVDNKVMDPALPFPVNDEDGNAWSVQALREMALAALACADYAESVGHAAKSTN